MPLGLHMNVHVDSNTIPKRLVCKSPEQKGQPSTGTHGGSSPILYHLIQLNVGCDCSCSKYDSQNNIFVTQKGEYHEQIIFNKIQKL